MDLVIRSMTGFARARRDSEQEDLVVTLRSVNHRALDIHTHLPPSVEQFEPDLRQAIKRRVLRGHIDLRISLTPRRRSTAGVNRSLLEAYLAGFEQLRREFGFTGDLDVNAALRVPGMLTPEAPDAGTEQEGLKPVLLECLEEALETLDGFRLREGRDTAQAVLEQSGRIEQIREGIDELRAGLGPALRARLQERLNDVLYNTNIEPTRIVQEAALIADRSDIHEETSRLAAHNRELRQLFERGGEVGKKLDFLLQEMNRETNTILSKTNGLGEEGIRITELGLELKSVIEKIREQALNLE